MPLAATGRQVRFALLIGCGFAALLVSHRASADRDGKIVRVERPRRVPATNLRACLMTGTSAQKFTCFGMVPPAVDDEFTIVTTEAVVGKVRVTKVEVGEFDTCQLGVAYDAEFEHLGPAPTRSPSAGGYMAAVALRGVEHRTTAAKMLTDQGRMKAPNGTDAQVWMAVDLSGDGFADMISTWREGCDGTSARPKTPPNRKLKPLCLDYWTKKGDKWDLRRTDPYYLCM